MKRPKLQDNNFYDLYSPTAETFEFAFEHIIFLRIFYYFDVN